MSDKEKETKDVSANHSLVETSSQSVATYNGVGAINLLDDAQVAKAEVFLKRMLRTEKSGIKTVEDGLAMIMKAQDLGLPFSSCVEHIHVVNGKTGIDIHIIKALLLKAGVTWECLNNYTPLYEYTDGFNVFVEDKLPDYCIKCKNADEANKLAEADKENKADKVYVYPVPFYKDFQGNVYRSYQLNKGFDIAVNQAHAKMITERKQIPVYRIPSQPVDYITKYKFYRTVKGKDMTAVGSFSYSDAVTADMFSKDTYKKYPKVLIGHRAFTYGARDIASDVLFGCLETTELKLIHGSELNASDVIDVEDAQIIE